MIYLFEILEKSNQCVVTESKSLVEQCLWGRRELNINKLYLTDLIGKVTNHYGLEIFISFFKNI